MSLWKFAKESTQSVAGSNTQAARLKGGQAIYAAGEQTEMVEKRNVIVTKDGWVRRENRTNNYGTRRTIDQIIVAANPGVGFGYANAGYTNTPDVVQMYVKLNANGVLRANSTSANLYVVFNTPVHFKASGNICSISLANTIGGNHGLALFANTAAQARIVNANNTLVFRLPPLQGGTGSAKATYKVNAQSISVTGNPLYNPDRGLKLLSSANLVVGGATANNLLSGTGARIGTFRVSPKGIA